MPLYEYECSDCGEGFEILVLDSSETVKCTICESENVGKQFSTFGLGSSDEHSTPSESVDSGYCSHSSHSSCGCC